MKCRTQVAVAVGAGYLLGRRRKARLTIALGTAALTGGLGGAAGRLLGKSGSGALPGELLAKLGPEAGQITEMVRGELFELGKAAARAAVNSQVDALTGKLHDRADSLRDRISEGGGLTGRGGVDEDAEPDDNASGEPGSEPDDSVADDEPADGEPADDDDETGSDETGSDDEPADDDEPPIRRSRPAGRRSGPRAASSSSGGSGQPGRASSGAGQNATRSGRASGRPSSAADEPAQPARRRPARSRPADGETPPVRRGGR